MLVPKQSGLIDKKKMNVENKIHVGCNFSFYFQSKIDSVNFRQKIEVLDNRFKWLIKDKKIT